MEMSDKELLKLYRAFYVIGDNSSLKILFYLERYGDKTFTQLKTELKINPATLSKKLKLLVQVGLVKTDKTQDHLRVFYGLHNHRRPLRRVLDAIERLGLDLD